VNNAQLSKLLTQKEMDASDQSAQLDQSFKLMVFAHHVEISNMLKMEFVPSEVANHISM
jgi:hypothetical protein